MYFVKSIFLFMMLILTYNSAIANCIVKSSQERTFLAEALQGQFQLVYTHGKVKRKLNFSYLDLGGHCIRLKDYPDQQLIVIEVFNGGSGTSSLTTQSSLAIISYAKKNPTIIYEMLLEEKTRYPNSEIIRVAIKYKFQPLAMSIEITDTLTNKGRTIGLRQ